MNDIRDLLPGRMRERTFQLKARRDAGVAWHEPQFVECKQCGRRATRQIWAKSLFVCPNCGNHQPIGAYYRLSLVLDSGSFREMDEELAPQDVLGFPGYTDKLAAQTQKTGLSEAAVTAVGRIGGVAVVAAVLDSRFFMGSMSTAVGERVTRAIEYAAAKKLPLVIFSASGGARMQEGIFSLMQMAKTSAAIERFSAKGGLYISVLTHPTTGGVTASAASSSWNTALWTRSCPAASFAPPSSSCCSSMQAGGKRNDKRTSGAACSFGRPDRRPAGRRTGRGQPDGRHHGPRL